jgi:hypothetical protein
MFRYDGLPRLTVPTLFAVALGVAAGGFAADAPRPLVGVLQAEAFRHYVEEFTQHDRELYRGFFPNAAAWEFLKDNICKTGQVHLMPAQE